MAMTMRERIAMRIQETCARPNMHIEIALHIADAVLAELETPTDGMVRDALDKVMESHETGEKLMSEAFTAAIRAAREGK
jgi:hypothetical protein